MQLLDLKPNKQKSKKRVGRGGSRGKTAGRGTKGQKSRSGANIRSAERDFIKKIPKLRGRGKNKFASIQKKPVSLNIASLNDKFKDGDDVNPKTLLEKGLLFRVGGKLSNVKILGNGDVKVKVSVSGCRVSKTAKEKIEKAGGNVVD